ncbi:MAG TPA: hypothetical protein VD771_09295, partial [Gemmatimonadaceae bacterium]|nr:hypothetical protein [Gemmatimonadaceae bacterium]
MWILIGLVLGTAVLVGPVRLITEGMGRAGWEQSSQDHVLIVVILLYLAFSLLLTRWVVGMMFRARSRNTRWTIAAVVTLFAAGTAWEWSNPAKMLAGIAGGGDGGSYNVSGGPQFIFGAYPDEVKLRELKGQGVTAVISLQHPGVVIEREGISAEKDAAKMLHLNFIQAPMLPWVSNNDESLEKLRVIARTGKGTYYVHCGLGRDRVNVAKRIIEAEGRKISLTSGIKAATSFADRPDRFERGSLAHIDHGKWLIPYPNKHEMFGFVLGGQAGHVVSLLDPLDSEQVAWNTEMEALLKQYAIPFTMRPLPANNLAKAQEIAKEVLGMPEPVTVIAPFTPWEDGRPRTNTQAALAFLKAYAGVA